MKQGGCFEASKWVLRLSVQQVALSEQFHQVLRGVVERLQDIKNDKKVTFDEQLFRQILLHVAGYNIRKDMKALDYFPENLREPFVRRMVKNELCSQVFGQIALLIRKTAVLAKHNQRGDDCFKKVKYITQTNLQSYLARTVEQETGPSRIRVSEEALGWFIVATLYRRFTSMVSPSWGLLGGAVGIPGAGREDSGHLHHSYDHTHRINITTPHFESQRHEVEGTEQTEAVSKNNALPPTVISSHYGNDPANATYKESTVKSSIEDEATNISSNFFATDVEKICEQLQGHSLPESLRGHVWMFCCIHRCWGDPPEGPSRTSELARLGVRRGIPMDSFESSVFSKLSSSNTSSGRQAIAELTKTMVEKMYMEGCPLRQATFSQAGNRPHSSSRASSSFPSSISTSFLQTAHAHFLSLHRACSDDMQQTLPDDVHSVTTDMTLDELPSSSLIQEKPTAPTPPHGADSALLRRAEVLLRADYILSGEVSKRGAAVALMVLISFPDASPVSEKVLRLFQHIQNECLPSEQLHHSHSILATAKSAFSLLSTEEPELHAHIQKVFNQSSDVVQDVNILNNTETVPDSEVNKRAPLRPPPPGAPSLSYMYVLLHPWLETGFVGYVSDFTAMFIWDQCFMFGGRALDWRKLLPVVCFTLMKILKHELMLENTVENIKRVLTMESKKIRTKLFSMLLRRRLAGMSRKKWFASPFQDTSLTLDKVRAVVMLQKLGRGRADRKRVQALALSQREEAERRQAQERRAVRDWKAEIERQTEEWRVEFLRKKEEKELADMLAVQHTLEHLIARTVEANTKREEEPKKVKTAYQLEWERLQSGAWSTGDNSEAGDTVPPESNRSGEEAKVGTDEAKVNDTSADSQELSRVVHSTMAELLVGAFEVIDKNQKERQNAVERQNEEVNAVTESALRRDTVAVMNEMLERVESRTESQPSVSLTREQSVLAAAKTCMTDMMNKVECIARDNEHLSGGEEEVCPAVDAPAVPKARVDDDLLPGSEEAAADVMNAEEQSEQFRATLPVVEVDAVAGFFEDKRAIIATLQSEKGRLKAVITRYKKKFEKKHGRTPQWNERTKEIKVAYEDYQEVSFNLKTFMTSLREDEDDLLRKWQEKKATKKEADSSLDVAVDAVAGFFEDKRAIIATLQSEKERLKAVIARHKKKFEKKHGRAPKWNERTKEIKVAYEDYQEVSFNLKKYMTSLSEEEDNLLRKWQEKE